MDIQSGIYGNYQKVLDENGKEVWRRTGGGASVDLSAYPTREEMKAYAPQKIVKNTNIYVNPPHADAADTWDDGRGLSAGKPFASFVGAWNFINGNLVSSKMVNLIVQNDVVVADSLSFSAPNIDRIIIQSEGEKRKIQFQKTPYVPNGCTVFRDIMILPPKTMPLKS